MYMDKKRIIVLVVLMIGLAALAVFAIQYKNSKTTNTNLNGNSQQTAAVPEAGKYIVLEDYKVRIPVLKGMEDVIAVRNLYNHPESEFSIDNYQFESGDVKAAIKSLKNPKEAAGCLDASSGPLGFIGRFKGFPDGDSRPLASNTKVIGDYFIAFEGPQDICTVNKSIQNLLDKKLQLIRDAYEKMESSDGKLLGVVQQGVISGSTGYSQGSYPLNYTICAEKVDKSESFCAATRALNPKYKGGEGYYIHVPVGDYYVYAVNSANPRDPRATKIYYSRNVSNNPSLIKVTNGSVIEGIDF